MRRRGCTMVALALALVACKSPGTVSVELEFPPGCAEATHVQVYLIRGGSCADCVCGDCLRCAEDDCTVGCAGGYCPISALDMGLEVRPPSAGTYAIIYQLLSIDADGAVHEVAATCADGVQLDKDGTTDSSFSFAGSCCPVAAEPDAGVGDAGTDAGG